MRKTLASASMVCLMLAITVGAVAQQGGTDLFREAERRFESGDYRLALDRYETLIREYPVSQHVPDAQFRIGVALYRTGEPERALEQLTRVARRYRSTRYFDYIPFWQGVISYEIGAFEDAVRFLDGFREADVEDRSAGAQAHYYTALARLGLGDEAAARLALERMFGIVADPASEGYAFTLLLSLYAKAELSEELLERAATVDPASLDERWREHLVLYEAEAYYAQGRLDEAISRYRRSEAAAAELATLAFQRLFQLAQDDRIPEEPADVLRRAEQALAGRTDVLKEFWLRVGIDSYAKERYDLAELYFRRIWDFRRSEFIPASVPLYLSRLLDQRGDPIGAEEVLAAYLDIYGDESEERLRVLIALGNLQLRLGRVSEAVATLQTAFSEYEQGPYFAEAAYQYAFALRESGREDDALGVIDSAFSAGRTGGIQADLLRLRANVLRDLGRDADALQALLEYLPLRPADAQAAVEYVNLLFSLERFARVVDEAPTIVSELGSQGALTAATEAKITYVAGLALLNEGAYAPASEAFARTIDLLPEAGAAELLPFALYYRGFALYRNGDYLDAAETFDALVDGYPSHAQVAQAAYLGGWSRFRLGDYDAAAGSLATVRSHATSDELAIESGFLLGRVLAAGGSLQQAAAAFRGLYLDHPESEYADDAWFEYAEVQVGLGNVEAAASAYSELLEAYPSSALAEPAAFRRAEVLYESGAYADAQEAFFAYRTRYRDGERMDAALYWGGVTSDRLGETAGALLLWERLVNEYRDSPFRPDAMRSAAVAHSERGEYRQALNLYTELRAAYPAAARAAGAERRIDELVLLISGLTEREADLIVTIEETGGAESEDGRQAIIELARMAIYEDTATGTDAATVVPLLQTVAEQRSADPGRAAEALFLRGEYRYRQDELQPAADLYLQAAAVGAADRDLSALAIYRAVVMYSTLGRGAEVQALVERLEEDFPGSEWLEEARAIQGGNGNE